MKELIKSITKREWQFVFVIALLIVIITATPYLYGYFMRGDNMVYTGIHHFAPGDTNVYLSMIEQVKQGNNILINLYTSEPQLRTQISPLWLVIGYGAKFFHLSNLLAYHVARSILVILFIMVIYIFISYFVEKIKFKRIILLIVVFSSGLGFLFNPYLYDQNNIYEHPSDIWITESNTFNTLFHSVHMTFSMTMIVVIFLLMLYAFKTNLYRYSIGAGLACLLMLLIHPFNGPTIYGVLAVYLILLFIKNKKIIWDKVKHFAVLCFIPFPAVLYFYLIQKVDWVIRAWNEQNILPSPSVWMYIIGYGFLLILLIFGLWITIKKKDEKVYFLIVWFMTSALLIYFPIYFQRRLSEGLHLPIAILAGLGAIYIYNYFRKKFGPESYLSIAFILILILFLPMTSVQVMGQDFYLYNKAQDNPSYFYLHEDEVAAMHWLRDNLTIDQIIFSAKLTGNYIPAYSGRIVWIGHGPQTADLENKIELQNWFWANDSEADKKYQLLNQYGVDYIFYSGEEKRLGDYNPATKDYLSEVFKNDEVTIYKVL